MLMLAGHTHLADHRQTDVLRDLAAPAVGADHVAGPDVVFVAAQPIAHPHGDAVRVLRERQVFGMEPEVCAARDGLVHQHRLHHVLRHIADRRR